MIDITIPLIAITMKITHNSETSQRDRKIKYTLLIINGIDPITAKSIDHLCFLVIHLQNENKIIYTLIGAMIKMVIIEAMMPLTL